MRIVGGIYRSRSISWPSDVINIRPTKDRIREAIFSALGDITDLKVLDLYSGSGAMGIEAISRGASYCSFVDNNKIANKTIVDNIKTLAIPLNKYEVLFVNDYEALNGFVHNKTTFDLIILDPPYKTGEYERVLSFIIEHGLLSNNGIIVLESDKIIDYKKHEWKKSKDYFYGHTIISILWR